MLSVSRIDAGRLTLRREPVDLGDMVRDVVTELMPLAQAREQKLEAKIAERRRDRSRSRQAPSDRRQLGLERDPLHARVRRNLDQRRRSAAVRATPAAGPGSACATTASASAKKIASASSIRSYIRCRCASHLGPTRLRRLRFVYRARVDRAPRRLDHRRLATRRVHRIHGAAAVQGREPLNTISHRDIRGSGARTHAVRSRHGPFACCHRLR